MVVSLVLQLLVLVIHGLFVAVTVMVHKQAVTYVVSGETLLILTAAVRVVLEAGTMLIAAV